MVPTHGDAGGIDQPVEAAVLALDLGDDALPIRFRRHVERVIDAVAAGKIGGDRRAAGALDRGNDRRADRARGAGHQHDFAFEIRHHR